MTEFFHYDDLTWPEVADLPRDVPLVLPLGSSFDPEKVAAQLSHPQRLGISAVLSLRLARQWNWPPENPDLTKPQKCQ